MPNIPIFQYSNIRTRAGHIKGKFRALEVAQD